MKPGDSLTGALGRVSGENVGTYEINSSLVNSNYKITYVSANLTITKKEISVVIGDTTRVYGSSEPAFSVQTVTDLVAGDTQAGLNILLSSGGVNVGDHAITATWSNSNYNVTFTNGTLTIAKKEISVVIGDTTRVYGSYHQ